MTAALTLLVDAVAHDPRLRVEHGLAIWIEAHGARILFDTGQTTAVLSNARALGIALERADYVVLSHGHYDHTGGLADVLQASPNAVVYLHPAATRARYNRSPPRGLREIGMPRPARESVAKSAGRIHWVQEATELARGVGLTGPIPRTRPWEDAGGMFALDPPGSLADDFIDELALTLETPRGLVILTGCAHAGLVNTLDWVAALHPGRPIDAVIGGFHLHSASDERLDRTTQVLQALEPTLVAGVHCTGDRGRAALVRALPRRTMDIGAGDRIEL